MKMILLAVFGLLVIGGILIWKEKVHAPSPDTDTAEQTIELTPGQHGALGNLTISLTGATVMMDTASGFKINTSITEPGAAEQAYSTRNDNEIITTSGGAHIRVSTVELERSTTSSYEFDPAHVKVRYTLVANTPTTE